MMSVDLPILHRKFVEISGSLNAVIERPGSAKSLRYIHRKSLRERSASPERRRAPCLSRGSEASLVIPPEIPEGPRDTAGPSGYSRGASRISRSDKRNCGWRSRRHVQPHRTRFEIQDSRPCYASRGKMNMMSPDLTCFCSAGDSRGH